MRLPETAAIRYPGAIAGACSSMVEPAAHNGLVGGSNPSGPTGGTADLAALLVPEAACPQAEAPRRLWWRHGLVTAAGVVIALLAVTALRRMAHEVTLAHLLAAVRAIAPIRLAAAAALTALSYVILTGYDWLALGHLGYRLPFRTVATASFASFTMSHTLGLTALTGGSVRFRLYTRAGVRPRDIVLIVALCGWTFWLGIVLAAGAGLTLEPGIDVLRGIVPAALDRGMGLVLLTGAGAYLLLASLYRREISLFGLRMTLPGVRLTLAQLVVGGLDLAAAAAALYVLLPAAGLPSFVVIMVVYAVAMIAGALSHAPGGMGVFETVVLLMLPGVAPGGALAALLLFRLLYTLLPFIAGLVVLARTEVVAFRHRDARAAARP